MSYAEEAIYKAKVRLEYAKKGLKQSVYGVASDIVHHADSPEDIERIAKALLLDKEVVDDAQAHYNFIMERYGKAEMPTEEAE